MPVGSQRFRVLLVSDTYPPVLGGSEVEAQRIAAAMIRRGHTVRVLCSGGPPMPPLRDWVDRMGVPVTILTRNATGLRKELEFAARVAGIILAERRRYDVIYFLMQGLHLAAGLAAAALAGVPAVVKIAGSRVIPGMRRARIGRLELDWMQRRKIKLMLLNPGMFEEALADGFSPDQLVWMPNPVDLDEFRPALTGEAEQGRAKLQISAGQIAVVYVGRLSHEKGVAPLMKGFARAAREFADAVLLLVGDGALRVELEALASSLGLSPGQIRFIGRVDSSEVPLWLRSSDIFALTSPSEGFPCALLEAMAAGLPSVVTSIPANLQLIDHGTHGLTTAFEDIDGIASAFRELFRNSEARHAMGAAARERAADNFSTDKVVERYETLFGEVVGIKVG